MLIKIIDEIHESLKRDFSSPREGVDNLLSTIANLKLKYSDTAIFEALCWELLTVYQRLSSCEKKLQKKEKGGNQWNG
ncbi:hypothetical protein [Desulfurobacterium indicum]|uniref:Uncharacterized protein n=1 Tax=Desulfurobacterium indicum TaxID=1914305 RepID=A0A1R1MJJ3_9BACT|nr:hypothetical protein [Desulfurobacterium indicum]OMH39933.1 hypothetical protein BLW93_07865 [Desulfurobacterium indicum]